MFYKLQANSYNWCTYIASSKAPRASALWRTVALSGFTLVILFLFVDALLLLGTMG